MSEFTWRNAGLTHCGLVRAENQDSYFISQDGRVYVVADGVGGSYGGAMASKLAVETLEASWRSAQGLGDDQIEHWMQTTIAEVNERIRSTAENNEPFYNMGTTIVMIVIDQEGRLHIGHAGDSRAMLVRNSELDVLTTDHTLVMELYSRGKMTLEQCRANPYRHFITRCLGHELMVELDYRVLDPLPGDRFLLASDGLTEVVREEEIARIVGECENPQAVCDKLLAQVLERNAPDNTTIITIACDLVPAFTKQDEVPSHSYLSS